MSESRWRRLRNRALVAMAIVTFPIVGSAIYWLADGQPGSPDDFRRQVAEGGLDVAWSNTGPRGGSGIVDTTCGPVVVTISEVEDALWVRWDDQRAKLSRETVDALLSCAWRDGSTP